LLLGQEDQSAAKQGALIEGEGELGLLGREMQQLSLESSLWESSQVVNGERQAQCRRDDLRELSIVEMEGGTQQVVAQDQQIKTRLQDGAG